MMERRVSYSYLASMDAAKLQIMNMPSPP